MTSRLGRGFHRLGVVLAVPCLLVTGWIAGAEAWQAWSTSGLPPERYGNADGSFTLGEAIGIHQAYFGYAFAWAGLAGVLYAAARVVGWVLDGFLAPGGRA